MRKKMGFTLVEIIVVLVILGVLLAVAIPSVLAYIEGAQATACAGNRDALEKELLAAYYADGLTLTGADVALTERQKVGCPAGGTISAKLEDGLIHATCSIHGQEYALGNASTIQSVAAIMEKYNVGIIDSNATASEGTETAASKVIAALAAEGLDLSAMGATAWQYRQTSTDKLFYWTDAAIGTLPAGTRVPILRYNCNTKTYTVWIGTVNSKVQSEGQTATYNALNTGGTGDWSAPAAYTPSTKDDKVQSYETALALFKQAQLAYPLPKGAD